MRKGEGHNLTTQQLCRSITHHLTRPTKSFQYTPTGHCARESPAFALSYRISTQDSLCRNENYPWLVDTNQAGRAVLRQQYSSFAGPPGTRCEPGGKGVSSSKHQTCKVCLRKTTR